MVDCTGFENQRGCRGHRGFESLPFRKLSICLINIIRMIKAFEVKPSLDLFGFTFIQGSSELRSKSSSDDGTLVNSDMFKNIQIFFNIANA